MAKVLKSNQEWQEKLSSDQYRILRKKETEPAFSGEYLNMDHDGVYTCAGCGNQLFSSQNKFDSGCGWPSFDDIKSDTSVEIQTDTSHGMIRDEVLCAGCGGHLGHVFPDGPCDTTGLRYCINSLALDFKAKE